MSSGNRLALLLELRTVVRQQVVVQLRQLLVEDVKPVRVHWVELEVEQVEQRQCWPWDGRFVVVAVDSPISCDHACCRCGNVLVVVFREEVVRMDLLCVLFPVSNRGDGAQQCSRCHLLSNQMVYGVQRMYKNLQSLAWSTW